MLWAYAIGQAINGNLADKFGGRRIMTLGAVLSCGANWVTSFASGFVGLILPWGINGYFQALGWAPGSRLISNWWSAVLAPALLALGVHLLLMWLVGWPLALVWNVAVLYVTLGFRQFSHHFTRIRDALEAADEFTAREELAQWQQVDTTEVPRSQVVRHVIEYSVLAAHRHVFGVLFWYSVLAALGLGPMGAVLYRSAEFVSRYWSRQGFMGAQPVSERLQSAARQAWMWIDWLPARLTALSFAVVGSFEEAIDGWRFHAQRFPNDNDGVLLAATAGAINVRLGGEALKAREDATLMPGFDGEADFDDSDSRTT